MNFTELVQAAKREAKGEASADELAALNNPENTTRWAEALRSAIDDAEHQFAQQQERLNRARADAAAGLMSTVAYAEHVDGYELWCKKASRYRIGLQQRLAELVAAQRTNDLAHAIALHRESTLDANVTPTDADVALWEHIGTE